MAIVVECIKRNEASRFYGPFMSEREARMALDKHKYNGCSRRHRTRELRPPQIMVTKKYLPASA